MLEEIIRSRIESLYEQLCSTGFDTTQLSKVKAWLKIVYLDEYGLIDEMLLDLVIDSYLYELSILW